MKEHAIYSPQEERLNVWTHGVGIILSTVGLVLLLIKSTSSISVVSSTIFGSSLILLYTASTVYHNAKSLSKRATLRIADHAAIYILIAGTYTPFSLITFAPDTGHLVFGIIWSLAVVGTVLKLFFTGKFDKLSTIIYVLMGWIVIFFINPLTDQLAPEGVQLLFLGGGSYTLGAIIYSIRKIKFNHAIFHVFVLLGSFLHFLSIYWYVID